MSILLESLKQKNPSSDTALPDLNVTHYDDELMGDEWLVQRVKRWKWIAICLGFLLVASWIFFIVQLKFDSNVHLNQQTVIGANQSQVTLASDNQPNNRQQSSIENAPNPIQTEPLKVESNGQTFKSSEHSTLGSSSPSVEENRVQYQPKKRAAVIDTNNTSTKSDSSQTVVDKSRARTETQSKVNASKMPTITLDELPENLREAFPSLELGSYVVADTPESSFVILDGAFYKINQVIAPNMILRAIDNQHIIVEFHQYRVKIPHQR